MTEWCGHIATADISGCLSLLEAALGRFNWLIVVLDSMPLARAASHPRPLVRLLKEVGANIRWAEEGIWIEAQDMPRVRNARLIVPFTAIYVFESHTRNCAVPKYFLTSECEQFRDGVYPHVKDAVEGLGACGYLADGCGLNYYLKEEEIYEGLRIAVGSGNS